MLAPEAQESTSPTQGQNRFWHGLSETSGTPKCPPWKWLSKNTESIDGLLWTTITTAWRNPQNHGCFGEDTSIQSPSPMLVFFVCYLMHLFLLVDSCSIPSVASKFRSGTLLLNLAMYCMFVNVYYIYILDDLDGQIQVPVVPVILFNDDVLPFRFPWAPHRKTDWNWWDLVGFFMVMDGISRIGIGLSGVCKARLVSWEKNMEKPMKNPWFPVKKNPFNPWISSNWWLVYLPPEEMMEFVRLDHPNWGK